MAEVCEPLQRLTFMKTIWTWNRTDQNLFDRAKALIKEDACMTFYDKMRLHYLRTDTYGVELENETTTGQIWHEIHP